MLNVIWLIPLLPLCGFIINVVLGRRLGDPKSGYLAAAMCGAAFVITAVTFLDLVSKTEEERHHVSTIFSWITVGGLEVNASFLADPLSITMALFVTGIGTLIHLYAIGYMHGDPKFSKFFIYLNLFAFSMLMLVLGENMLVTFLGWEGVGTCSYLLISFWHTKDSAATAGKKAFVTNRVGDWGFMIGMFLAFQAVGSLSYGALNHAAEGGVLAKSTATAITMMLFIGACGKSAQLPLYIWLPDAMEGPTPVSALIHAATMVTAGVYLMVRVNPVIAVAAPWASAVIAVVGAATALFAATIAVAQTDIKKVLAYSTVSQLGFMFLAVGSGAYVAAIFHMVTHAFFKALLFLGSGSVIHGMHHEQDMRRMGALRKFMPITAGTFIIGWLAIAGIPPFAGFWSKDEILLSVWAYPTNSGLYKVLWGVALVTALLTAFYMTRQVIMVFFGKARWNDHAEDHGAHGDFKPHESPAIMLLPLVVLCGLSIVGGGLNLPFTDSTKRLLHWLEPIVHFGEVHPHETAAMKWALAIGTAVLCAASIGIAFAVYQRNKIKAVEPQILADGWNYDRLISWFMGKPGRQAFEATAWVDRNIVDGAVNGVATTVRRTGGAVRRTQSGFVRNYALLVGGGVVLMLAWFFLRALGVLG